MRTIAFFGGKAWVGTTTLIYHIAWMCAELGRRALVVDLDPQVNLTTMFLDEDECEKLWPEEGTGRSTLACLSPIVEGWSDVADVPLEELHSHLYLLPGDLGLSRFEDRFSDSWPRCLDGDKAAYRVITAFHRIIHHAAETLDAEIVLIDVGPNLGAINRAALIAAEHVVMPLAPDLLSLQGLRNLGPTLHAWRENWRQRLNAKPADLDIPMPTGAMKPAGYVVVRHVERRNRHVGEFQRWGLKIPEVYQTHVLGELAGGVNIDADTNRIGLIKNYPSLMQQAEDARKPVFKLTTADGAIGAHAVAVSKCYLDFKQLTQEIIRRTDGSDVG